MSIIKCPECGKEISDRAVVCLGCGCPSSAFDEIRNEKEGKEIFDLNSDSESLPSDITPSTIENNNEKDYDVYLLASSVESRAINTQVYRALLKLKDSGFPNHEQWEKFISNAVKSKTDTLIKSCDNPKDALYICKLIADAGGNSIVLDENGQKIDLISQNEMSSYLLHCPVCGSTDFNVLKKGFGSGKAVAGLVVAGPIGLAAGAIGSNKIVRICKKCGRHF